MLEDSAEVYRKGRLKQLKLTLSWCLNVSRSLQRTLNELKEYQKQHDHYLRQQEILEKHKLIQEEQILRNIIHETQMAKEAQLGTYHTMAIY